MTNDRRNGAVQVCVIVVSYNYGEFLADSVESVLQQSVLPDEILIMDDASTDNTNIVGEKYASLYPGLISYRRNSHNMGIVETFNKAVRETVSEFICFLGADNKLHVNYVEECRNVLLGGRASIAYTDFRLFGPNAKREFLSHPEERRGRVIDGTYYEVVFPDDAESGRGGGNFIHGSAMYSRRAFDTVGGYYPRRPGKPEDANLFRRMLRAGFRAQKAKETWLEYRQHSDAQANVVSRTQGELTFYKAYSRRLEMKVRVLEASFGLLSPAIKLLSRLEKKLFDVAIRVVRAIRRI